MDELSKHLKETMATPMNFVPPDRDSEERAKLLRQLWSMLIVLSVLIFILFAGAISIRVTQSNMTQAIEDARIEAANNVLISRENGYKNRAQACRINLTLGTAPDQFCLEPEVTKYYDSTVVPTEGARSDTRVLMCKQWDKMNQIAIKLGEPPEVRPVQCSQV